MDYVERMLCILCFHNPASLLVQDYKKTEQQSENSAAQQKFGESAGARTRDPNIKSVVLYLLSYGFSEYQIFRLVVQR